jgi:MoaA/NifB/PqqE/SkfB family radical SAM enzyme
MEWATILRIISDLKRLGFRGRVSWFLINEPLLDDRIPDIIRRTRAACPHAFLSLVSNGDQLTFPLYSELMSAGLDALGISIYSAETLQRVRSLQNDPRVRLMDWRVSSELKLENRGGNVRLNGHYFASDTLKYGDRSCRRPFTTMSINSAGKVVLCSADFHGQVIAGDVSTEHLDEIWRGPRLEQYRQKLESTGRHDLPLCSGCSHDGSGSPLQYPLQSPLERRVRTVLFPVGRLVRIRRKWAREQARLAEPSAY